jgi:CelD/BcsL family acetyltransferase involved in cellulose biosynthesis
MMSQAHMLSNSLRPISEPLALGARLSVRAYSSWEDLEQFRLEWDRLLSASAATIFSSLEWLSAWWRNYGSAKELRILLFFARNDLVGAGSLYLDTRAGFGRKLKVLRFVGEGSDDSDNLDFLVRPGYEDPCAQSFLSWLQTSDWDISILATLPENSVFYKSLVRQLFFSRWPLLETGSPHFYVSLPDSWESYLQSLSPEFRPLLSRYPRRLRSKHQVHIYRSPVEDLDGNLSKLFSLHQQRWQERALPGAFSNPARCRFYREIARLFADRDWLEFWLMDLDGTTVAAQFCVRSGPTVHLLQEGFDPKFSKDKIGYALRAATFEHFIGVGVKHYDFLGGGDTYKLRFGSLKSKYRTIHFARPSTPGSARLTLDRLDHNSRQWVRENLPGTVVQALRRGLLKVNRLRNLLAQH